MCLNIKIWNFIVTYALLKENMWCFHLKKYPSFPGVFWLNSTHEKNQVSIENYVCFGAKHKSYYSEYNLKFDNEVDCYV